MPAADVRHEPGDRLPTEASDGSAERPARTRRTVLNWTFALLTIPGALAGRYRP
jgi:hypothetical protein